MADSERRVVVCPRLCFLFSKFGVCELKKIKNVMYDFFLIDDIVDAKKILMEDLERIKTDNVMIGVRFPRMVAHRDSDINKRTWKDLEDILHIVTILDECSLFGQLPRYVVDCTDNIPTLRLEDGELKYLMAKIEKMEDTVLCLQESINRMHRALSAVLMNDTVEKVTEPILKRAPTEIVSAYPAGHHQTVNVVNSMNEIIGPNQSTRGCDVTGTLGAGVLRRDWATGYPSTSSAASADERQTDNDECPIVDDGNFSVVVHRRKRRRMRSKLQMSQQSTQQLTDDVPVDGGRNDQSDPAVGLKKSYVGAVNIEQLNDNVKSSNTEKQKTKPLMIGAQRSPIVNRTGSRSSNLSAAKPLFGKAVFCIDNVNVKVTVTELEQFVRGLNVRVLSCHEVKPRRTHRQKIQEIFPTDHKTFRLCVNKADTKMLLNPEKWPADISISNWYFQKKDQSQTLRERTDQQIATAIAAQNSDVSTHTATEQFTDAMNLSAIDTENVTIGAEFVDACETDNTILCDQSGNPTESTHGDRH